jgi:hypothetical protein
MAGLAGFFYALATVIIRTAANTAPASRFALVAIRTKVRAIVPEANFSVKFINGKEHAKCQIEIIATILILIAREHIAHSGSPYRFIFYY